MSPSSHLSTPVGQLSAYVDMVEVTDLGPKPDRGWTYTDKQGHDHYYDGYPVPYPTLVDVSDGVYWCEDCRDDHDDGHLECRVCGEHISPGLTGGDMYRRFVPGRRRFELDGVEISEARYVELLNRHQMPTVDVGTVVVHEPGE